MGYCLLTLVLKFISPYIALSAKKRDNDYYLIAILTEDRFIHHEKSKFTWTFTGFDNRFYLGYYIYIHEDSFNGVDTG